MTTLKSLEKLKLEKYLQMDGGFVCDFINRTFAEFIAESVNIDIYENKYSNENSGSKAARLRSFWSSESNQVAAKLLEDMVDYWRARLEEGIPGYRPFDEKLYFQCKEIIERVKRETPIDNLDSLQPNSEDKDFAYLATSIKDSIEKGQPGQALDRLHTFVVKYLRELCKRCSLAYDKNTPLNALIGAYIKVLYDQNLIDSIMSQKILKSSIGTLEALDQVRNNQSLAHDNPVLNYEESILIFNNVSNTIRFVESIERKRVNSDNAESIDWDDISYNDLTLEEAEELGII